MSVFVKELFSQVPACEIALFLFYANEKVMIRTVNVISVC